MSTTSLSNSIVLADTGVHAAASGVVMAQASLQHMHQHRSQHSSLVLVVALSSTSAFSTVLVVLA